MTRFHVVIPVHNRYELTRLLLGDICRSTHLPFKVFLVDDGSFDGTSIHAQREFGSELPLEIIPGDGNLWWGGASQKGIEIALASACTNDYIVLMNNDARISADFFDRAGLCVSQTPGAILCPLVVDARDGQTLCKSGAVLRSWSLSLVYRPYEGAKLSERNTFPKLTPIDFMRAQATIIPISVIRSIGNIAGDQLPQYHSDGEYAWRARRHNVSVFIDRDLDVLHRVDTTGSFNAFGQRLNLVDLWHSLFDIRSANCLRYKWRFACICCPKTLRPVYMVADTAKIICRSVATILLGERTGAIRTWVNGLLRK